MNLRPAYATQRDLFSKQKCKPKTQDRLSNKTKGSGMRNFLSSCWSGSSQKTPKGYRLLLLPLVALVRSCFLPSKALHSLDIGLGGGKLELIWETCPWRLAPVGPEGAMQDDKEGKSISSSIQLQSLQTTEMSSPETSPWCNSGHSVLGIANNCLLDLTTAQQERVDAGS